MLRYLIVFGILFAFFCLVFIYAQMKKNNGYIDIAWSLGFMISALVSFFLSKEHGFTSYLVTAFVLLWGGRLAFHLFRRNFNKKEDYRYAQMRETFKGRWFYLTMFLRIYVLQLILNFIIGLSVITVNLYSTSEVKWWAYIGIAVWLIGYFFEVVGDHQLKQFISKPENKGKLMTTGLWSRTRHPNYFGEATMWWGIFIIAVTAPIHLILILSPITITFFLLKVSGVPMLEARMSKREGWEAYAAKTNAFLPKIFR